MSLGAIFCIFAGVYYWIGKMSGRQYPEWAGQLHFWAMFIGSNLTFFPQHFLGRQGMPRRYIDYPEAFAYWNQWSSLGAFLSFASFVFFIGVVFYTVFYGRRITENNYWNDAPTRWNGRCHARRRNIRSRSCPNSKTGTRAPRISRAAFVYGERKGRSGLMSAYAEATTFAAASAPPGLNENPKRAQPRLDRAHHAEDHMRIDLPI